ncbi:hypothetical protein ABZ380_28650, partial [Streptomyces sp. NPDC005901]
MTHPVAGISRRARMLSAGLAAGVLLPLGAVATAPPRVRIVACRYSPVILRIESACAFARPNTIRVG